MSQVFPGNELPFYQGVSLKDRASPRACLKNVNMPKRRLFFRHTLPIFLEIHPVFLRQIGFVWRKNFSPLVTFPFFKRRLVSKDFEIHIHKIKKAAFVPLVSICLQKVLLVKVSAASLLAPQFIPAVPLPSRGCGILCPSIKSRRRLLRGAQGRRTFSSSRLRRSSSCAQSSGEMLAARIF